MEQAPPGKWHSSLPVVPVFLFLVGFWVLIWVFGAFFEPLLVVPFHVASHLGLGNSVIAAAQPWTGCLRSLVLIGLLGIWTWAWWDRVSPELKAQPGPVRVLVVSAALWLPIAFLRVSLHPGKTETDDALFALLPVLVPVLICLFFYHRETNRASAAQFSRISQWTVFGLFAGAALAKGLQATITDAHGTILATPQAEIGLLITVIMGLVMGVVARTSSYSRLFLAGGWILALLAWRAWPLDLLLFWWMVLLVGSWRSLSRVGWSGKMLERFALRGIIPFVIVGLSGQMIPGAVDLHHEAETLLPTDALLNGWVPFRDFFVNHSLGTDCGATVFGFLLYGKSVWAERLARFFLAAPLRGILAWLFLREWLSASLAGVLWLLWALAQGPFLAFPNDVLRLEPTLVFLWVFWQFLKRRQRGWGIAAGMAGMFSAFFTPEVGGPALLSVFAAVFLVAPANPKETPGAVWLVSGAGIGATVLIACLAGGGILGAAFQWTQTLGTLSFGLVARWYEQSVFDAWFLPHVLFGGLVLGAIWKNRKDSPGGVFALALFLVFFCVTVSATADTPMRLKRNLLVAVLLLAACSRWPRPRSLLVVFLGAWLLLFPWMSLSSCGLFSVFIPHASWKTAEHARLGPVELPPDQIAFFENLIRWHESHPRFVNVSNSQVETFLLQRPWDSPFVPLHIGFSLNNQIQLLKRWKDEAWQGVLYRSGANLSFWSLTPYSFMFHALDAWILSKFQFDCLIGPMVMLKPSEIQQPQTMNDLLPPGLRRPWFLGFAPGLLGEKSGDRSPVERMASALAPVLGKVFWLEGEVAGKGGVRLTLRPRIASGSERVVEIIFRLNDSDASQTWALPLWNICHSPSGKPEEDFQWDLGPLGPFSKVTGSTITLRSSP